MAKTSLRFDKKEFETRVQKFLANFSFPSQYSENFFLAFVHKSVLNETEFYTDSNERLEYL